MTWLERLKELRQQEGEPSRHRQNRQNPGFVSFGSAVDAQVPPGEAAATNPDAGREPYEERAASINCESDLPPLEAGWPAAEVVPAIRSVRCADCGNWTADPLGGGGIGQCRIGNPSRSATDGLAAPPWPHARRYCKSWKRANPWSLAPHCGRLN